MWEFIISGYIPGTDTQVSLENLSYVGSVLLVTLLFALLVQQIRSHTTTEYDQKSKDDIEAVTL